MNDTEKETIRTIRGSAEVAEYEGILRQMIDAEMESNTAWNLDPESGEHEAWAERVDVLNAQARDAALALLASLIAQGVPASLEDGGFNICYRRPGKLVKLAGFVV